MQSLILRRSHPAALTIDLVGITWFVYFLWHHQWEYAIGAALAARLTGLIISWNADLTALADTVLGKLALMHLHPINLLVQVAAAAVLIWGIWSHSTPVILSGVSLFILGHAFGWQQVHPAFALKLRGGIGLPIPD
jgi:hypothetical protein